jgi:hypothetical protein
MLSEREADDRDLQFMTLRDAGLALAEIAWVTGYGPEIIETVLQEIDAADEL